MSHLSSQPPEITAEKLVTITSLGRQRWAREKRFADVLGRRIVNLLCQAFVLTYWHRLL